jgi:hypothetical protein
MRKLDICNQVLIKMAFGFIQIPHEIVDKVIDLQLRLRLVWSFIFINYHHMSCLVEEHIF